MYCARRSMTGTGSVWRAETASRTFVSLGLGLVSMHLSTHSYQSRRTASHDGSGFDVLRHHSAGADQRTLTDGHAGKDYSTAADARAAAHSRRHDRPIGLALWAAIARRARVEIVDEHHAVADEHF